MKAQLRTILLCLCSALPGSMAVAQIGTVLEEQKISDTHGGLGAPNGFHGRFGVSISNLGDLDGDGRVEIAVGASADDDSEPDAGAAWIVSFNADGSIHHRQKINEVLGGFPGDLRTESFLGTALSPIGDIDGDGQDDLAIGLREDTWAYNDEHGGLWITFLNADSTVRDAQLISPVEGGFTGQLNYGDLFGSGIALVNDIDADGRRDLAIGAPGDDDGRGNAGALWLLMLNADGTVKGHQKISLALGQFTGDLDDNDRFGTSVASLGDLDGNGVVDLAVGAPGDDDGGQDSGALWILMMRSDGTVYSHQKISATEGGFSGIIDNEDAFGSDVTTLGDLDNDGVVDLAVGAPGDNDGGEDRGAVWILFLRPDGTVKNMQLISQTSGGFAGMLEDHGSFGLGVGGVGDINGDGVPDLCAGAATTSEDEGTLWLLLLNADGTVNDQLAFPGDEVNSVLSDGATFGSSVAHLGDLDGDGWDDIAVGATALGFWADGPGTVWILFLDASGQVKSKQAINDTEGGFAGQIADGDRFGNALATIPDLNGDGRSELVAASTDAVWILFLNPDGTVQSHTELASATGSMGGVTAIVSAGDLNSDGTPDLATGRRRGGPDGRGAVDIIFMNNDGTIASQTQIAQSTGGLGQVLNDHDRFGSALAGMGDLDGDGTPDLAVGATGDYESVGHPSSRFGAVWLLFLNADGTVKSYQKITTGIGGFTGSMEHGDAFGFALSNSGDLDGDGITDLAVGAPGDDDFIYEDNARGLYMNNGAIWILLLNSDGTVHDHRKISNTFGGLEHDIDRDSGFGSSLASLGDRDGDGNPELAAGAPHDEDNGVGRGALYVLTIGSVPLCAADIAGGNDGVVDVFDLLELLMNWGTGGAGSDLAEPDDTVDIFDLLELLSAWGGCS